VGALVYGEPVTALRLASFAVIWAGLGVMARDMRVASRG
jgi:EamA domain-containing membrane protein RarD